MAGLAHAAPLGLPAALRDLRAPSGARGGLDDAVGAVGVGGRRAPAKAPARDATGTGLAD